MAGSAPGRALAAGSVGGSLRAGFALGARFVFVAVVRDWLGFGEDERKDLVDAAHEMDGEVVADLVGDFVEIYEIVATNFCGPP